LIDSIDFYSSFFAGFYLCRVYTRLNQTYLSQKIIEKLCQKTLGKPLSPPFAPSETPFSPKILACPKLNGRRQAGIGSATTNKNTSVTTV